MEEDHNRAKTTIKGSLTREMLPDREDDLRKDMERDVVPHPPSKESAGQD